MRYPRKQTFVIFAVCAVSVGGLAFYVDGTRSQSVSGSSSQLIALDTSSDVVAPADSGDWRSQLLADASSSSAFKTAAASTAAANTGDDTKLTPTDMLGREFFTNYMQLRQAGLDTNTQAVNSLADQLVSDSAQNVPAPKTYGLTDLHIITTNDSSTLALYEQSLLSILTTYIPDQEHNEAVITEQALDSGDTSQLSNLDPLIANYQTALSQLLSMSVPGALAQYHLELVNGVAVALANTRALRASDTDPVTSLSALSLEGTELGYMNDGLVGIRQYYSAEGLQFNG